MGVGYNPRIVTDGLVLCLDAANKRSYPGSGTTWIDRNHVSSNTSTPPTVTGNIRIGKAGSAYCNGSVGALKLYNRVLTAKEVLQNYEATKGRYA